MSMRIMLAGLVLLAFGGPTHAAPGDTPLPRISPVAAEKVEQLRRSLGQPALEYLEGLKDKADRYLAPSEIDPRFTTAIYVNAKGHGPTAQRMWVLHRDTIGGSWKLGMWDDRYWRHKGLTKDMVPPYSWLVSTGRKYRGDNRSGPTPTGVFAIDERRYRVARGYRSAGMIHVMYIDLHYSSGRRSGVAFHGTTRGRYRRLGSIDSHGCIRMTQPNALALVNRLQGRDDYFSEALRWGEVPRFWQRERGVTRYGYSRDGSQFPREVAVSGVEQSRIDAEAEPPHLTDETRLPEVLTKTGYRAIAIIFKD